MMDLPRPRSLQHQDALFLDLDGTLVMIARRPEEVVVAADLRELLTRTGIALNGALALISGRTIAAVDHLVDGGVRAVAGIHGLERRTVDGVIYRQTCVPTAALLTARKSLAEAASRWPRAFIEHKGVAFALHYRLEPSARRELTAAAQAAVAAAEGALKLIEGDSVLEVSMGGSDKGAAVHQYLAEPPFHGRRPVFVGDDTTDEAAFREVEQQAGLSVIVGSRRPTAARHTLPTVIDVHRWIAALTEELVS
jgi:trehalose 6-phosphate phosphatase